jgi:hypothetical protein
MKLCTKGPFIIISQIHARNAKKKKKKKNQTLSLTNYIITRHVVTLVVTETLVKML